MELIACNIKVRKVVVFIFNLKVSVGKVLVFIFYPLKPLKYLFLFGLK